MEVRVIERHQCRYDDGRPETVRILQEFRTVSELSGKTSEVPGTKRCVASDGSPLNYRDETTFETLDGETLTRV